MALNTLLFNQIFNQKYCLLALTTLLSPVVIATSCFAAAESSSRSMRTNQVSADYANALNLTASNPSNTRLSSSTINLVKQYEGFRSYAYIDTSGLPVIGYGQSKIYGKTVTMGQYVTQAEADAALAQELYYIQRIVESRVLVKLSSNQLAALTSLVYNAGTRVITDSTLSRKLNAGDYIGAAREFPRWNKANQGGALVAMPGLTKRRLAEQKMFMTP